MTEFSTSTITVLSLLYHLADVLHTVGPINGSESKLRSCYERCLQLVLENNIRSVVSQTISSPFSPIFSDYLHVSSCPGLLLYSNWCLW